MNNYIEKIKEILKYKYEGRMSDEMINAFAEELNESVFVEQYNLEDIFLIVFQFEEEANIEESRSFDVFTDVIDMLESGEKTAQRLYESFMYGMDILKTFLKLIKENEEYISAEKIAQAKEKAFGLFDKQLLEWYGITE